MSSKKKKKQKKDKQTKSVQKIMTDAYAKERQIRRRKKKKYHSGHKLSGIHLLI